MVVTRDEDRQAPPLPPVAQLPLHRERLRHPSDERVLESLAGALVGVQLGEEELGALVETPVGRVGGVLVRGDDIGALLVEEAGHGGDDAGAIGAVDQ